MARTVVLVMTLISVSVLLLLAGNQRPTTTFRDYRPAASEIWATAAVAVSSAGDTLTEAAAGAVSAASEAAQAAVDAASSAFTPGTASTSEDPTKAAIVGFAASEAQRSRGTTESAADDPATWCRAAARDHGVQVGASWGTLSEMQQREWRVNRCDQRVRPAGGWGEAAGTSTTSPAGASDAAPSGTAGTAGAGASPCNHDHSKALQPADLLCRVPVGELAFVSLANAAYGELAINWALLLLPVLERVGHGDRAVIASLDAEGVAMFTKRKLPTMSTSGFGGITFDTRGAFKGQMDGFRWRTGAFREYGVTKAAVIIWLLRNGRDVCMSDVDAAWISTPYALMQSVPEADVLSGTDCLHVPWDADRSPRKNTVKNCGHQSGSDASAWFNTGVMIFRARARTIDLMIEWRDLMDSIKGEAQIDDQLTFNQLIGTVWAQGKNLKDRFKHFYPLKSASADGRVVFDGNGTRRVHAVPASAFCSAHVYHVQQSADPKACLVLHLTFVEGWPKNPAKYWRLREAGLLAVRPEPFDGKYLSFTPPQPGSIPPERQLPDPPKTSDGKGWSVANALLWSPRLAAHLHLIDRHIAALRNAIGIARALGRQLVMPMMLCLCERAEGPTAILPQCTIEGASTPVPHVCPLESVYDVARVENIWHRNYLQLRPWTFLNNTIHPAPTGSRPFDLAADVLTIRWHAEGVAAAALSSDRIREHTASTKELTLARGLSDVQLHQAIAEAGVADARVIHLESAERVFGGFEAVGATNDFQKAIMSDLLGGWSATWCCTSWNKPAGTLKFKRPLALPSGRGARGPKVVHDLPEKRECYWQDQSDCNSI